MAADAVGISVRSAQRIDRGDLQPEGQQQRRDSVLVPMLEKAPQLEPQTLLLHLERMFPGQEWYRRKRTLQRRVEQWRALQGPACEVMFLQEHRAGVLGISDFTLLKGEPITVAGEVLEHRLFHFRLPYSGWCHVAVFLRQNEQQLRQDLHQRKGVSGFVANGYLLSPPLLASLMLTGRSRPLQDPEHQGYEPDQD